MWTEDGERWGEAAGGVASALVLMVREAMAQSEKGPQG
jgi:hypothetical protein